MKRRVEIRVYGRVQGVFYRASTRDQALRLNIFGTVRNADDGSVIIDAEGEDSDLTEFIEWCRKGPERARVDNLQINELSILGFKEFKIKRF